MKKPTGVDKKKVEVKQTKKEEFVEEEQPLTLVVDSKDTYQTDLTKFYIHPARLALVKNVNDKIFESGLIQNTNVDHLTSMNLSYVLRKLKVEATLEVIICQPLSVMQSYDAKQVEANAKLAGFDNLVTSEVELVAENNVKTKTLKVTAVRPVKNPNKIEIEVTKTTTKQVDNKGKETILKSNVTLKAK